MLISTRSKALGEEARLKIVSDTPDLSFSRYTKLRSRRDFVGVLRKGTRCMRPSVVLYARLCPTVAGLDRPKQHRLGIVASKKVGNSVRRNFIKRVIRECFRRKVWELPQDVLLDFVCIARRGKFSSACIADDLCFCLHRLCVRPSLNKLQGNR